MNHVDSSSSVSASEGDIEFLRGISFLADGREEMEGHSRTPAVDASTGRIRNIEDSSIYQTLLAADALRYLTLEMTASKASGHPGGFASGAEAVAALIMLGHKNLVTEVGHHAPGYYAAAFLDGSLERMGIRTVEDLCDRYREQKGLLGHITPAIPGMVAPAGPLGQGPHFAMALALLHRKTLVPLTIGDGGMGEPYVLSGMLHFLTLYPKATNFLPVLIWNGYSQEHRSMCSTWSDEEMIRYFQAHGFRKVLIADAKGFDDRGQEGAFVDSTVFSPPARMKFVGRMLSVLNEAVGSALGGTPTAVVVKQLKGAGVHARGSKAHNLTAVHTLDHPDIEAALRTRALSPAAWRLVRENFRVAGGGSTADIAANVKPLPLPDLGALPLTEHEIDDLVSSTTSLGTLIAELGRRDPGFLVTNADGNEASGMMNVNKALGIRHPIPESPYEQRPDGRVYEPLSEDACAGLAAALALHGSRALWCSYESFAINGLPIWQTVTQALAELRRPSPSALALFTACALEQGRNGWTHQRPEVESYIAAMMRNGNVYPLFPVDANTAQAAFEWALGTRNKGVVLFASKTPLPIRVTISEARKSVEKGYRVLADTAGRPDLVIATAGDLVVPAVLEAADRLKESGIRVRVAAVVNPRRCWRPSDIAWEHAAEPDGSFLSDGEYEEVFGAAALLCASGGSSGVLDPVLIRSRASVRDILAWKRGDTTAGTSGLLELNGLRSEDILARALEMLGRTGGGRSRSSNSQAI